MHRAWNKLCTKHISALGQDYAVPAAVGTTADLAKTSLVTTPYVLTVAQARWHIWAQGSLMKKDACVRGNLKS